MIRRWTLPPVQHPAPRQPQRICCDPAAGRGRRTRPQVGSPRGMVAADIHGNGIKDIAALDDDFGAANGLFVWMGNPDGTFQQTPVRFIYTTDHVNQGLMAGDFNREGKMDFATVT